MRNFDYEKAKLKINNCNNIIQLFDFINEDYVEGLGLADAVWENQCLEQGDRELVKELINKAFILGKLER